MSTLARQKQKLNFKHFEKDFTNPELWRFPLSIEGENKSSLKAMLDKMQLIRRTEEKIADLLQSGDVNCPCHLAIGQEAVAVGIAKHLNKNDRAFGAHRSHAHYLSMDGDVDALFAEVMGKESGCSKGMGGSMHIYAGHQGFMGSVPIVAGTVSIAVGAALAAKKENKNAIAVAFFGDGACEEGVVHECLNLAAVMQLPVLFVIENNLFSSHLDIHLRQPSVEISRFAEAHLIDFKAVDGNDVIAVSNAANDLIAGARNHNKPALLEAITYRHRGHVGASEDVDVGVRRSISELNAWKKCDPIERLKTALIQAEHLTEEEFALLDKNICDKINMAVQKGREAPYPENTQLLDAVYDDTEFLLPATNHKGTGTIKKNYGEAIRDAHAFLLENDPRFFVMGQGVWSPWYVGNTMTNLDKDYGKDRVIDTPVSENACTGAAVGAGLCGYRPLVIHPRIDFMAYCIDPIINQAAKWGHMLGGQAYPAITIRGIINRGGEQGAQHSQSLHSWFAHIPGLRVVMPASVKDARDLLIAANYCKDPVLYIDDRWLYDDEDDLDETPEILDLREVKPKICREGNDITIVASSYSVKLAKETAQELDKKEISCEIIDLRVINPLDYDEIVKSVQKTGRLCVIDGGWETCGLAGEIIAGTSERLSPTAWKAAPRRITLPAAPAPTSKALEDIYYPTVDMIMSTVEEIF